MKKRIEITWDQLQVGDIFAEDGSKVIEIENWHLRPCFLIKNQYGENIIVSDDHLLAIEDINEHFYFTELSKSILIENSQNWIAAKDLYELYNKGIKVKTINGIEISSIKIYEDGKPQNVRCISTNTGTYVVNNFVNHNTARKLFYAMSDTQVYKDCGGPYIDVMHCKMPEGHVCEKCAHLTKGGERIKEGQLIGGLVSTNMSEALTQLSMKQMHVGSSQVSQQQNNSNVIMGTLDGWSTSKIIQKMSESKSTEEMRQILYEGLKDQYHNAGIKQDDFNIQMVAKKLTSYKRTNNGLQPVNPGEKCDIVSIGTIGNSNNIFKVSQLSSGYKYLTNPLKQKVYKDAANQIMK